MSSSTIEHQRVQRKVVSFVRRSSRMRPHQRQRWEANRHRYVIDVPRAHTSTSVAPGSRLDLPTIFGRTAPLIVEIGPGTGESLVPMARQRPDADLLAFEVYTPAVASLVGALSSADLANVRVVQADAVAGLRELVDSDSVAELWTFFPDPWPKARHHKRRLVDAAFVDRVATRLHSDGRWRLATDWPDYAREMRELLEQHPAFVNEYDGWAPRWSERPVTRFEQRGVEAGRNVLELTYRRR